MKKRGRFVQINISNRFIYTFIILGILTIVGVGVYALTPGGNPSGTPSQNPGHLISTMDPPSPCTANQFLQFDGTDWKCASQWTTSGNNMYSSNTGNVGIGTTNPTHKLEVVGNIKATGIIGNIVEGSTSVTGNTVLGDYNQATYYFKIITSNGLVTVNSGCALANYGEIRKCSGNQLCGCTQTQGQWRWQAL